MIPSLATDTRVANAKMGGMNTPCRKWQASVKARLELGESMKLKEFGHGREGACRSPDPEG